MPTATGGRGTRRRCAEPRRQRGLDGTCDRRPGRTGSCVVSACDAAV